MAKDPAKKGETPDKSPGNPPIEQIVESKLPAAVAQPYTSVKLLRPQDLLSIELRFLNFVLNGSSLVNNSGSTGLMMVVFQSQSIGEEVGTEINEDGTNKLTPPGLPAKMMISDESRLVYRINKNVLSLDVNELLNWNNFELVVNSRARSVENTGSATSLPKVSADRLQNMINTLPVSQIAGLKGLSRDQKLFLRENMYATGEKSPAPASAPVAPPAAWETSLEIPFRLFLSPTTSARWKHLIQLNGFKGVLKENDQLYELWHTRMGTQVTTGSGGIDETDLGSDRRLLRILWGEGTNSNYTLNPLPGDKYFLGNSSLNNQDRHQLVHESSNFNIPGFTPQPVKANKLFLTTLGAYLDSLFLVDGDNLKNASPLDVSKWRHIQTLGRDHYVEVVKLGYIMPFGHHASLIRITERKPHAASVTATNFKKELVVIAQPVKEYNYRDSANTFMNFCFSSVELITKASPLLDPDTNKTGPSSVALPSSLTRKDFFLITSDKKEVQFKIKAEDLNGNVLTFDMPLYFVSIPALDNPIFFANLAAGFPPSTVNLNGQKLSLAPKEGYGCDTHYPAYSTKFRIKVYPQETQKFLPVLINTKIVEPSVKRLTSSDIPVSVFMIDDKNDGHVFAQLTAPVSISFDSNADKSGGFVVPNFDMTGLSKSAGAFGGDVKNFSNGNVTDKEHVSAKNYFTSPANSKEPKLFGVFKLSELLDFPLSESDFDLSAPPVPSLLPAGVLPKIPNIPNLKTIETAGQIITSYTLGADLKGVAAGPFASFSPNQKKDSFSVITRSVINKNNPSAVPEFSTTATLKAFSIDLLGLMKIQFKQIVFTTSPGKSADVNVEMGNPAIEFQGPLCFLNAFQTLIPDMGFSDPPYLDVTSTGVTCGYTLALPNLQLGAFTLSNLSLAADVNLPFTGARMFLGFRFCEKQQPFTLTIAILGGGGYFGFEVDLHGLRQIDAALEFGAAVALNLGVASGAVSIMAGIYFKMVMKSEGNITELSGYVRINGAMSILGLITATVELYMALTYIEKEQKAKGEASVSIKVHVLFFSKSVTVHTCRTFAGSGKDPNFQMAYPPIDDTKTASQVWRDYCDAFAA